MRCKKKMLPSKSLLKSCRHVPIPCLCVSNTIPASSHFDLTPESIYIQSLFMTQTRARCSSTLSDHSNETLFLLQPDFRAFKHLHTVGRSRSMGDCFLCSFSTIADNILTGRKDVVKQTGVLPIYRHSGKVLAVIHFLIS